MRKPGTLEGSRRASRFERGWQERDRATRLQVGDGLGRHPPFLLELRNALNAAAHGDLGVRLPERGLHPLEAELGRAFNLLLEQCDRLTDELLRADEEIRRDGVVGPAFSLAHEHGDWGRISTSVNGLLTTFRHLMYPGERILDRLASGDLDIDLDREFEGIPVTGLPLRFRTRVEVLVDRLRYLAGNLSTLTTQMRREGRLGLFVDPDRLQGSWRELVESVNLLSIRLSEQLDDIARISKGIAAGDLAHKVTVDAEGEILELKNTINATVDQLRLFAGEVTRVAREVGTEGKLGGQASVPDVSGTWRDLTETVNVMASNLTDQVRGIGKVVTAVANGDLSQRLTLVAKGEIAALADTINGMTDTLRTFSDQVTTVAREVGAEGRLGGQANVPSASGIWRKLTDNVNRLAANLTIQVRAISEVAAAVTKGDLSRSISVEAAGELLALKDTINQMIANLRSSMRENQEQDWLKSSLAEFFNLMQGQASLDSLTNEIITKLTPAINGQHGAFYLFDEEAQVLELKATYAHVKRRRLANRFTLGEGLVGQCAVEGKTIVVSQLPEDYTVIISSGLGEAPAREVLVSPIHYEGRLKGVVEVSSFTPFTEIQISFVEQLMLSIGVTINLIRSGLRTAQVLDELKGSNQELEEGRRELEEKAKLLEQRNLEIAEASRSLETKARELTRASQYKSEFLANMSHEIRTPLNSMLILAQMLATDEKDRLGERQREWASMIHSAGQDLLVLINQVLDLSRVEAGRLELDIRRFSLKEIESILERTFRPLSLQKGLDFSIERSGDLAEEMVGDRQLLVQILLNLVSNAFKFTAEGEVEIRIEAATSRQLDEIGARDGVAFHVRDTGIGIPAEARERIFEAFSQADGTITRSFEGTGLGLAISKEYANALQGTLEVESEEEEGSTFTLILPTRISRDRLERRRLRQGKKQLFEEDEAASRGPERKAAPPRSRAPAKEAVRAEEGEDEERRGAHRSTSELGEPDEPARGEGERGAAEASLEGKTALIVEDDVRNLYATTALLESLGMLVLTATDARSGYRILERSPGIDVILMDVMMPEIDGYQAIARIREMPGARRIPILVFTAKASKADRRRALEVGADGFVLKPAEIEALSQELISLVGEKDGA